MVEDRAEAQQRIDEGHEKTASIAVKVRDVLKQRDLMIKRVYKDEAAFIRNCSDGLVPGFDNAESMCATLHRNCILSAQLKELERPDAAFGRARTAHNEAGRAIRGYRLRTNIPEEIEARQRYDQCRTTFLARKRDLDDKRTADEERLHNFLLHVVLPLLNELGEMPPQGWSSSVSCSDSSNASVITRPIHDQGQPVAADVSDTAEMREWHIAEIEQARDLVAAWETQIRSQNVSYEQDRMQYMFTHPTSTREDFDEHYLRKENRSFESVKADTETALRDARQRYEQFLAEAKEDEVANLPFESTSFGAAGDIIESGGRPGADELDQRIVRKCECFDASCSSSRA